MAWEWVAPTATAAVGISGAAFTWLSSRSSGKSQLAIVDAQQGHALKDKKRTEKRDASAGLLAALDKVDREIHAKVGDLISIRQIVNGRIGVAGSDDRSGSTDSGTDVAAERERFSQGLNPEEQAALKQYGSDIMLSVNDYDEKLHDVLLTCSTDVVHAALAVREDLVQIAYEVSRYARGRYTSSDLRAKLVDEMREDLGYGRIETITATT